MRGKKRRKESENERNDEMPDRPSEVPHLGLLRPREGPRGGLDHEALRPRDDVPEMRGGEAMNHNAGIGPIDAPLKSEFETSGAGPEQGKLIYAALAHDGKQWDMPVVGFHVSPSWRWGDRLVLGGKSYDGREKP